MEIVFPLAELFGTTAVGCPIGRFRRPRSRTETLPICDAEFAIRFRGGNDYEKVSRALSGHQTDLDNPIASG